MMARIGLFASLLCMLLLGVAAPAAATPVIGTFSGFLSEIGDTAAQFFTDQESVSGSFTYDTDKAIATLLPLDHADYLVSDATLSVDIGAIHIDDGIGPFLISIHGGALGTLFGMLPDPAPRSGSDNTIPGTWIRLNLLGTDGGVLPDASLPTTSFDVHLIDQPFGFVNFPPGSTGLTIFFLTDLTIRTVGVDEPSPLWLLGAPLLGLMLLRRRAAVRMRMAG
jgi:hypothetical protein